MSSSTESDEGERQETPRKNQAKVTKNWRFRSQGSRLAITVDELNQLFEDNQDLVDQFVKRKEAQRRSKSKSGKINQVVVINSPSDTAVYTQAVKPAFKPTETDTGPENYKSFSSSDSDSTDSFSNTESGDTDTSVGSISGSDSPRNRHGSHRRHDQEEHGKHRRRHSSSQGRRGRSDSHHSHRKHSHDRDYTRDRSRG